MKHVTIMLCNYSILNVEILWKKPLEHCNSNCFKVIKCNSINQYFDQCNRFNVNADAECGHCSLCIISKCE